MAFDARKNTATVDQARQAVEVAVRYAPLAGMASSAIACANDAARFLSEGRHGYAHEWACESLRYSLGNGHPTYRAMVKHARPDVSAIGGTEASGA